MIGLFFCILFVTADSAPPPPTPCPVSLFHTGQRDFFSALTLLHTGHSYRDLFFCIVKRSKTTLLYSVPKGLLVKWGSIAFSENQVQLKKVELKTFESEWGWRIHITSESFGL